MMQNHPEVCFRCGPLALDRILSHNDSTKALNPLIYQSKSTTNGFSLSQVAGLSEQLGLKYQMALRSSEAPFIVPAVVHWKVGHFAAVVERDGDRFLVEDHTFHSSLWMSAHALNDEASGYFLVPPGSLPSGWRSVSDAEAQTVWGKGLVSGQDPNGTSGADTHSGGDCGSGGMTTYNMCGYAQWRRLWFRRHDNLQHGYDACKPGPSRYAGGLFTPSRSTCFRSEERRVGKESRSRWAP